MYRPLTEISADTHVPDQVIVEIGDELAVFFNETANMQNFDIAFDEVFNEILMYLADKNMVELGLKALGEEMANIHSKANGFEDSEALTQAVLRFAEALYAKFVRLGLYSKEGLMPFESVKWLDSNTPILNKFKPKPVLQGGALRGKWEELRAVSNSAVLAEL